jgi:hypothetical protein
MLKCFFPYLLIYSILSHKRSKHCISSFAKNSNFSIWSFNNYCHSLPFRGELDNLEEFEFVDLRVLMMVILYRYFAVLLIPLNELNPVVFSSIYHRYFIRT